VGYAYKKSRLWVHYKYSCVREDIRWLKRDSVSRPMPLRDPLGAPRPLRVANVAQV